MNYKIDARGQDCPRPVIMTKQKLDEIDNGVVTTLVDNEVAKENVSKLADSLGLDFTVEEKGEDYYITINKGSGKEMPKEGKASSSNINEDMVLGISSNIMGRDNKELGKILMKNFIYTVSESKPYPSTILFYNEGVRLACEDSEVLNDLIKLEKEGVEIISCGICLDYLNIQDKLEVGSISNMYNIYEKLRDNRNMIIG